MYECYLDRFVPSKVMREYLKDIELKYWQMADIIYKAPVDVKKKLEAIREVSQNKDLYECGSRSYRVVLMTKNIESALAAINKKGFYTLESCWFEDSYNRSKDCLEYAFVTFDEAFAFSEDCFWDLEKQFKDMFWFQITSWVKDESGKLVSDYIYYIVDHEIRYINSRDICDDMIDLGDLYVPTPFQVGDIVKINGTPFAPPFYAFIVDIGDNMDCCSLQALSRRNDGSWYTGAVKHGMIGEAAYPQMSPLYRIELIKRIEGYQGFNDNLVTFLNMDSEKSDFNT